MAKPKKNPYPNKNFAIVADYLEELILLNANERGLVLINEENGGYEDVVVNDSEVKQLTIPAEAVSATIMVEGDSTSSSLQRVLRYKQNGTDPTANSGFALGDNDVFQPVGKSNLDALRFIGTEAGKNHTLRVQYYQTAQTL